MTKTTKRISLVLGCIISCSIFGVHAAHAAAGVTARENLEKLLKTKSCKGCNLSGLNLNRMDLAGVDLEGADLSFSKMFLTNLAGANLQNSTLTGAKFGGADLGDADLRGADLRGVSLDGAYLGGANLDGQFVTDLPFEEQGIMDIKKEVYVDDQAKPKLPPEKQEVKVGTRRDFDEPPPQLASDKSEAAGVASADRGQARLAESAPRAMDLPQPPAPKKIKPVRPAVVDEPVSASEEAVDRGKMVVAAAAVQQEKMTARQESPVEDDSKAPGEVMVTEGGGASENVALAQDVPQKAIGSSTQDGVEPAESTEDEDVSERNTSLAVDKKKRDNLSRLLDRNRCYGCDLSGLDLAGKDFEGADLEKADLSGCNLVNADLEEANLKGANLQNTDIRNADLRDTDFYKADLTGANLTGSKMQGALFDGATLNNTKGIDSRLMTTEQ